MITRSRIGTVGAYSLPVLLVAICAAVLWRIPAITAAAAAPVLLLIVLLIARALGTGPALAGSACAGLSFTYYFLPPAGLFIQDLTDWVAFISFTVTAIVVGELAARAERRQLEAEEGRREIEQLYQQLGAAFERASEAEAARRSEQLKAALLDALTHNLRTPLTAIKASVTALISTLQSIEPVGGATGLSKESRRELLQVIDEESDRLNRFIEGLSVADRQGISEPQSLRGAELEGIVREAVTRADTVVRRHRVQIALDTNIPPLAVDPAAVAEVLYILLDNASKYSPPGTAIRIAASTDDPHYVRLSVADEGPGIPAELRETVFRKFFRIPGREPVDPRRAGIGLGLPIARRLVESQAGTIAIESPASGRGTLVVMRLPIGSAAGPAEPVDIPAAAGAER